MPSSSKMLGWLSKMQTYLSNARHISLIRESCWESLQAVNERLGPRYMPVDFASSRPHPHLGNSQEKSLGCCADGNTSPNSSASSVLGNSKEIGTGPKVSLLIITDCRGKTQWLSGILRWFHRLLQPYSTVPEVGRRNRILTNYRFLSHSVLCFILLVLIARLLIKR